MATTKSNTTTAGKPNPAELRKQLARDISNILHNPECPTDLFNEIAERVCDWSSDLGDKFYHSPDMVERCLEVSIAREEKRKGGTR